MKEKRREGKKMKQVLSCVVLASLFTGGTAFASGYRIPEQSIDSTAKAGANIASTSSADAAFFNPAAVSFLKDGWLAEIDATYIHLTAMKYEDSRSPLYNGKSKVEDYLVPTLFLVSPEWQNMRFGFSITTPYGLGKRWEQRFPSTFASKFELRMTEFNPTLTYAVTDKLSVAGGVRVVYGTASVMSNGTVIPADSNPYGPFGVAASRAISGDAVGFGYNVAIDYKASDEWNFAATYRSKVDLNFEGDASMTSTAYSPSTGSVLNVPGFNAAVDTQGRVTVIAPAVLALSTAYTLDKVTFELTFDRTFWSDYRQLNFDYDRSLANYPVLAAAYGPVEKEWKDTTAIRLGLEYAATQSLTLMAGIAHDDSPAPARTLGFELPDSEAWLFSLGVRYAITDRLNVGIGALADIKDNRKVYQGREGQTINGEFTDGAAVLVSCGIEYRF